MRITKVYFMLWVADMKRALDFYTHAFGLIPRFTSDDWSELAYGDATIALHGGASGRAATTSLGFQVDNLEAACEAVRAAGGTILNAPSDRPGEPIRLATLCDTEGNRFSVTQPR